MKRLYTGLREGEQRNELGIVYTSTTPELIECVNEEIKKILAMHRKSMNYQDPSILAEVREHGYVTAGAAARLVGMYMQAVSDGADAVLNCCSSVGEVCRFGAGYWPLYRYSDCPY